MTQLPPEEIFSILAGLNVGQVVPAAVYIADYRNGETPRWTVAERQTLDDLGVQLLLVDPDNGSMFDQAAVIVLTFPTKTLRTPVQPHAEDSPAKVGGTLCDMRQQERANRLKGGHVRESLTI